MNSILLVILSFLSARPGTHAGNVIVVDGAGGGDFAAIQPAVDAAADGDTVLVKTGNYTSFVVANKALAIVGDTGNDVQIAGHVRAHDLAAGKALVLANLHVTGTGSRALSLSNNAGSIRIEYCSLAGAAAPICAPDAAVDGWDAVRAVASADVSFVSTSLLGGASGSEVGSGTLGYGGTGLAALSGSKITGYSCSNFNLTYNWWISGGGGTFCGSSLDGDGTYGGLGIWMQSGTELFASRCEVFGGGGGNTSICLSYGGDGGTALVNSSVAHLLECYLLGGGPGCGPCGFDPCGNSGANYAGPGQFDFIGGQSRSLLVPDRVPRENASVSLWFLGQPGDEVYLYVSRRTSRRFIPAYHGVLLPQLPQAPVLLGTIPTNQVSLIVPYSFPDLGPGVESRVYYLQAIHRDTHGQWFLGTPISFVVVDQGF